MQPIPGYTIVKLLAKGGMASIYLAEQDSLQRQVVLKCLDPDLNAQITSRFIDEGRIIASLKHPNILTIFDVISSNDNHFISMEYLEGGDLKQRLKTDINTFDTLDIIIKISDALHLIHKQGIIHGDVKPANILFRNKRIPVLADFGISHQIEVKQAVNSETKGCYASPLYASPEVVLGQTFDYRTDMYSLGIIMYEMLTGQKPFSGATEIEMIANSVRQPIPKLPKTFYELQPLLDSLLAKQADLRLSDTSMVSQFLNQYIKEHPELKTQADETTLIDNNRVVQYIAKENRKKKWRTIFIFLFLTSIALFSILSVYYDRLPVSENTVNNNTEQVQIEQQNNQEKQQHFDQQELAEDRIEKQEKLLENAESSAKNEEIASLLLKAAQCHKKYFLTTPKNNNALYYYQQIQIIEPENKKAKLGIKRIVQQYANLATAKVDNFQYQEARELIEKGLTIEPDNQTLLKLHKKANLKSEPGRIIDRVTNFFN